mmetsp:Transcript_19909/g.39077  ORF Transcript_19909/g.39077 Transcript_19909/m.39077 type:complete len:454 (-) Transcript_19909:128-1489(-)|eukprot:CAMPEP_0171539930 /NCGR_PEP_ID=MMETSP0960-20121227/897_1 /TAXON_ID=87120 /ORGANISM="Aurantiochytrium limacinum, Strain ATCCMYA-1381" /LENGTH=453 /DNA_ID=CAMNT_0012087039 /DNA_START=77 /DNA_END=1438 /DNA_ORIENTATION=-
MKGIVDLIWLGILCILGLGSLDMIEAAEDGLARTPPMGWRSWNAYHDKVSQDIIVKAAREIAQKRDVNGRPVNTGGISLLDLGFNDVGLDDNWQACNKGFHNTFHDQQGMPLINTELFPDLKKMTDDIHALGLKAGWYGNNCICAEKKNVWSNNAHYIGDVKAHFLYGFDSTKLDGCGAFWDLNIYYQLFNQGMHAGKMMIENCHWGRTVPTLRDCPYHMFRTSGDISASWESMFANLQTTIPYQGKAPISRPGCWAYPDMLEVGLLKDSRENKAHFAAWCIVSSPLILGYKITNSSITQEIWPIISNKLAIAINQEWAGHPGSMVYQTTGSQGRALQVWTKPLSGDRAALLILNDNPRGAAPDSIRVDPGLLGISASGNITSIIDVWSGKEVRKNFLREDVRALKGQSSAIVASIEGHDSVFLVLSYCEYTESLQMLRAEYEEALMQYIVTI